MTEFAMYFSSIKLWYTSIRSIFLLLILSASLNVTAQVVQSRRHEILYTQNDNINYEVAPAGNRGVFLFRNLTTGKEDFVEVNFLDTAFQQKWHGFISIEQNYVVVNRRFYDSTLFLILRYNNFTKNNMQIIAVHCKKGDYVRYNVKNFIPFNPTEFQITKQAALIGGYFNRTPVVMYYDFETYQINVVPGLFSEPGELTQVKTYSDASFDILTSAKNIQHKKTMWIRNYDADGKIIKNVMLEPDGNKNLIFGRAIKTDQNMQIVAGVYSTGSTEYSKGIFVASIDPLGMQQIRYYNYGDLKNFFKFMRAKREERVKNRIQRRKIKGRKIRFNYRLLVHELVPYNNQFVLLGEAFYPRYVTNNYSSGFFMPMNYANYARYPMQNGRVFDGFYYTHAVVMGFDNGGKLIWDNSFEINDIKTYNLEQFVKIDLREDKLALLYLFNNEIRSKIIKGNEVLEGKTSAPIKLKTEHDITRKTETGMSKLDYWYQDFFIAYGTQTVSSFDNGLSSKRRVFFINKISYK
jgi:hypothetical protein